MELPAALPRTEFASLPTELRAASDLAAALGIGHLMIKNDGATAHEYGGNKVRKLEYLLGDALQQGCDAVLTYGMTGSNHALATAVHAQRLGLECYAVLVDQPVTPAVQDKLRWHARIGTRIIRAQDFQAVNRCAAQAKAAHPGGAQRVYDIPWGGSSWLGASGFVGAGLELATQLADAGLPEPDRIYIACGTMGSTAGLAIGLRAAGLDTRIHAVCVTPPAVSSPQRFSELFAQIDTGLHATDPAFPLFDDPLTNVSLRSEFFDSPQTFSESQIQNALKCALARGGLQLDTTYTGRAMAILIADAQQDALADQNVVFWNTYNSRPFPDEETGRG